jgi:type II secretion system protein G
MYYTRKFAFTLVEILIVIIILGILTVALITKLTSIQARARDTARFTDLRAISTAIETYKVDNGSYPTANYIAAVSRQTAFRDLVIPSVFAQSLGSSLDTLT